MKPLPDMGALRAALALVLLLGALAANPVRADSAEQIRRGADHALAYLDANIAGAGDLLARAAAVLVFPDVVKLGFGVGGEYGEGVLMVAGEPAAYYATSSKRFGLPPGSRTKSKVVIFASDAALQTFLARRSWRAGEAGLQLGAPEDSRALMVGYVFSEHGLVPGLTLNDSRFVRLAR